jgi:hypothetical protein
MPEIVILTVLYVAVFLVLRPLGASSAAAAWIQDWGRRAAAA